MTPDISRRAFIGGAAALGLAACSDGGSSGTAASSATTGPSTPPTTAAAPASSASAGGPARFVSSGPKGRNAVALTFHTNGDVGLFERLAKLLQDRKAPVTAFMVGQWLDANASLGKELHAFGHELANHTYTHPTFLSMKATQQQDEIARCRAAIASVTGAGGGRYFRISGTSDGLSTPPAAVLAMAGEAGYEVVAGFDVDPLDFEDPGADLVASRTIAALHDGAIVSLHFGHAGTLDAMPRILDAVEAKGLQPVTLSSLLG